MASLSILITLALFLIRALDYANYSYLYLLSPIAISTIIILYYHFKHGVDLTNEHD